MSCGQVRVRPRGKLRKEVRRGSFIYPKESDCVPYLHILHPRRSLFRSPYTESFTKQTNNLHFLNRSFPLMVNVHIKRSKTNFVHKKKDEGSLLCPRRLISLGCETNYSERPCLNQEYQEVTNVL